MKYNISTNGYYYKEYKNGKKVRVSKKTFDKNNKVLQKGGTNEGFVKLNDLIDYVSFRNNNLTISKIIISNLKPHLVYFDNNNNKKENKKIVIFDKNFEVYYIYLNEHQYEYMKTNIDHNIILKLTKDIEEIILNTNLYYREIIPSYEVYNPGIHKKLYYKKHNVNSKVSNFTPKIKNKLNFKSYDNLPIKNGEIIPSYEVYNPGIDKTLYYIKHNVNSKVSNFTPKIKNKLNFKSYDYLPIKYSSINPTTPVKPAAPVKPILKKTQGWGRDAFESMRRSAMLSKK